MIIDPVKATKEASAAPLYSQDDIVLMVADWYEKKASDLIPYYLSPASMGNEPTPDAFTVNNRFTEDLVIEVNRSKGPSRVRLVNAATFSMFKISVDGMNLTVS